MVGRGRLCLTCGAGCAVAACLALHLHSEQYMSHLCLSRLCVWRGPYTRTVALCIPAAHGAFRRPRMRAVLHFDLHRGRARTKVTQAQGARDMRGGSVGRPKLVFCCLLRG
eukprot:2322927-Alexandrium_andersonii.AAC.1